jgi:large subunit ribosomal protein L24
MKIKKGDIVVVTTGKDRGKEGNPPRAFPKKNQVLVEGVAIVSRHQKSRRRGSQGQIVTKPMPLPVANVGLKDSKTGKPVRVGYIKEGTGKEAKKIRVTRPNGTKI